MADQTAAVEAAAKTLYESFTPAVRTPWGELPAADFTRYVFKEAAMAALQAAEPHALTPRDFWRVIDADGAQVLTSYYEDTARGVLRDGRRLQRQYRTPGVEEWRDVATDEKED